EVVAKALKDENLSGFDILVGSVLADELNLHKNDKLSLIFSNLSPSGFSLVPQAKRFDVKARFTSGLIFYDKAYMYTDVNALRKVLGISNQQSYDGVHVYSENAFKDV
ncbi:ABC transporter permease, partial [Campylobacter coli]|nr:ABC transporter permease [Campylobacter coli]